MRDSLFYQFKDWYLHRLLREQALVCFLLCTFVYALFSVLIFQPLDRQIHESEKAITESTNQKNNWQLQLEALSKIKQTPLYQQWKKQNQVLTSLQQQYRSIFKKPLNMKWEDIIVTILQAESNVKLENITSTPETLFSSADKILNTNDLYEQHISISVLSNYFETITYLEHLEKALPNVHWETLNYDVISYPTARVKVEFTIIYEK